MIAVIAGASGLVGNILIHKLLNDSRITKVISVGRKSLELVNPKLEEVKLNDLLEMNSVKEKLKGDIYFCCLGTTIKKAKSKEAFRKIDHDAVVMFAKIAAENSAKAFSVISAMGANKNSAVFYNKVKGEMESDLKSLNLKNLIIFEPGLLIGHRDEFRFGELAAIKVFNAINAVLPSSFSKRIATDAHVLAEHMLTTSLSDFTGVTKFKASQI